jgi:hypothetical protein
MNATSTSQPKQDFDLWKTFTRLQNPMMKWLLASPAHFLTSDWYLLMSVTGKKSGQVYTMPVQYKQVAHRLTIISSKDYQWWRNLRGGANVDLVLRGNPVHAYATVSESLEDVLAAYDLLYPTLAKENRDRMASNTVVIRVELL